MGDNQDMEKEILENREKKENISEELDIDVISPNLDTKMSSFSRKFDNLKVKYRKNPKIFIAMIICLVFAVFSLIGSSYALLTYVAQTGKVTTISAGTLALDFYNESDAITLNDALPQQDNDALSKNSEYTFTLKNNGSLNANYVVSLNNTCSTSKSYTINGSSVTPTKCIPDQYIKVGIKEENGDYKVLSKGDNSFVILSGSIGANSSKTYKMKIWLDYSTPNEYNSVNNQTIVYSGKLGLEYEQGKKTLDRSGANAPELTDNMIPVYYDETSSSWKKADSSNNDEKYRWYDYNNKVWANAVTVTSTNRSTYLKASAGTEIPMDDINTMWVWIPRYTYTYLNTNTPEEIKIKFEKGTNSSGTIKCTDNVTGTSTTSETCTDSTNNGLIAGTSTYTHPAFTFGDKKLTGFWVGKFELTGSISDITVKPDLQSIREQTVSAFETNIMNMKNSGNKYGFTTNDDTHMIKNMEWGAVTYLSHSKYGINKEVALNSNSSYKTGCGPQSEGSPQSGSTCNSYNTTLGQLASTTGNIYGVYDMSGGSWEYVMGNLVNSSGEMYSSSSGYGTYPESKYYDKYSYGEDITEYTRGKLGDATKEMAPTGTNGNWYKDYAYFPYSSYSWFWRGGGYNYGSDAGLFGFSSDYGSSYSDVSSRSVLGFVGAL